MKKTSLLKYFYYFSLSLMNIPSPSLALGPNVTDVVEEIKDWNPRSIVSGAKIRMILEEKPGNPIAWEGVVRFYNGYDAHAVFRCAWEGKLKGRSIPHEEWYWIQFRPLNSTKDCYVMSWDVCRVPFM